MELEDLKFSKIELVANLYMRGNFDLYTSGIDSDGNKVKHEKQEIALRNLTDKETNIIIYGGGIGGGKSDLGAFDILMKAYNYPETRWVIARNSLKSILASSFVSFKDICKRYDFTRWKFNAQKNFIELEDNGSIIDLVEIKYKPSDPMFEDLGSVNYTGGWIDEGGETHEGGVDKLFERIGRYKNDVYDIPGKLLITCNPKKGYLLSRYYEPFRKGTLDKNIAFVPAAITDNPFIPKKYIENVKKNYQNNRVQYERLINCNWYYDESDDMLCDYDMVKAITENDHVADGVTYLTGDIARFGSNLAVLMVWSGWKIIDLVTFDKSRVTEVQNAIIHLRNKYKIPKNRCIVDEDGVGGGVVDNLGILGFNNQTAPIGLNKEMPNYTNLQAQCNFILAEKINNGEIYLSADVSPTQKQRIFDELDQIRIRINNYGKLGIKSKAEISEDIKGSPDYRDAMSFRAYFDLKPKKRSLIDYLSSDNKFKSNLLYNNNLF